MPMRKEGDGARLGARLGEMLLDGLDHKLLSAGMRPGHRNSDDLTLGNLVVLGESQSLRQEGPGHVRLVWAVPVGDEDERATRYWSEVFH